MESYYWKIYSPEIQDERLTQTISDHFRGTNRLAQPQLQSYVPVWTRWIVGSARLVAAALVSAWTFVGFGSVRWTWSRRGVRVWKRRELVGKQKKPWEGWRRIQRFVLFWTFSWTCWLVGRHLWIFLLLFKILCGWKAGRCLKKLFAPKGKTFGEMLVIRSLLVKQVSCHFL